MKLKNGLLAVSLIMAGLKYSGYVNISWLVIATPIVLYFFINIGFILLLGVVGIFLFKLFTGKGTKKPTVGQKTVYNKSSFDLNKITVEVKKYIPMLKEFINKFTKK